MITVAGGTGRVGKTLTQALVRDGERVRVLTRDPEAAQTAFGDFKVEIVPVDFDDTATLRAGFNGSDRAYMSYGTSDRQVRDEIALIDAAIGAKVPYLVNLSVAGAGGPHINSSNVLQWHTEIDAYLATTGVAATVLRPTTFTDGIVTGAAKFVPSGAWGGHAGAGRVALIDSRDVAAVSAAILTDGPQRHADKIYDLSGPTAVTMDEIAGYTRRARGGRRVSPPNRGPAAPYCNLARLPGLMSRCASRRRYLTRDNVFAPPSRTVFELTGHNPRSVRDWVDEHISLFAAPAA
jgi:uncharacterized protein YbjT (DUF2867 family)